MAFAEFSKPIRLALKVIEFGRFALGLVAICFSVYQIVFNSKLITGLILLLLATSVIKSIRSLVLTSTALLLAGYAFCKYQGIQFPIPQECFYFSIFLSVIFYKNWHLAPFLRTSR